MPLVTSNVRGRVVVTDGVGSVYVAVVFTWLADASIGAVVSAPAIAMIPPAERLPAAAGHGRRRSSPGSEPPATL